jgi:hypothetical protein
MNDALMASAYQIARENYKAAELATFSSLDSTFAAEDFDTIHQASQRGMRLHTAAMELAQKVWARMISYEKAEEILGNQFTEFPGSTRQKALSDSYTDTR